MQMDFKKLIPKSIKEQWLLLIIISFVPFYIGIYWLSVTFLFFSAFYQVGNFFFKWAPDSNGMSIYFFFATSIMTIVLYALIYKKLGIIPPEGEKILDSDFFYFSIVTWTTLGYGDFRPSQDARMYAASQALLGYLYMGILIGKIFSIFGYVRNENF